AAADRLRHGDRNRFPELHGHARMRKRPACSEPLAVHLYRAPVRDTQLDGLQARRNRGRAPQEAPRTLEIRSFGAKNSAGTLSSRPFVFGAERAILEPICRSQTPRLSAH